MKIFRFCVVFLLSLLSSLVHAEGTMIATVLQADFSKDPEIRLLVRVVDVGWGRMLRPWPFVKIVWRG